MVLSENRRVAFIQVFERIYHREPAFEQAGTGLGISPEDTCPYLGFEHDRVCMATVRISPARPVTSIIHVDF